jgi:hypothetical protein
VHLLVNVPPAHAGDETEVHLASYYEGLGSMSLARCCPLSNTMLSANQDRILWGLVVQNRGVMTNKAELLGMVVVQAAIHSETA